MVYNAYAVTCAIAIAIGDMRSAQALVHISESGL